VRLSLPKTQTLSGQARIDDAARVMSELCSLILCALVRLFRSRAALQAEILVLRHQPNALRRKSPNRVTFCNIDRLVFAELYRLAPGVLAAASQAGDGDPLASCWFPRLLALEVATAWWAAQHRGRHSAAHSRDEHR
jgi:hypothetical protein